MSGDLTSYLASRYLVADTKPSKKRKRKHNAQSDGLVITDDDDAGWTKARHGGDDGDGEEDGGGTTGGATVAGTSSEFRKAKKSNWKTLGGGRAAADPNSEEADAADAIISAAAAETEAAQVAQDEAPVVASGGDGGSGSGGTEAVLMSDGTHAGLQSAAAVVAQLERRRQAERAQYERERKKNKDDKSKEDEVVYRDATGRRIDLALRRQEVQAAARAAEQKARDAQDALKGDVQRAAAQQRRAELADAALLPVARSADDAAMNAELKAQARWNDPMAAFLTQKPAAAAAAAAAGGTKSCSIKSNRPLYKGPAAPNRYGIRPGYRWDGVDRGIGFEAERFKGINRRERNKGLEYAWQMDE